MEKESLIEQAQKAADRLEQANKVYAELLKQQENLDAKRILGGHSEAGQANPELSKEEKDKMDMKNYFKGTAIEKALK